jgi:formate-dependent nitrite reductase cytochrome c552 subunit
MRRCPAIFVISALIGLALNLPAQTDELGEDEVAAYRTTWSTAVDRVTPDGYLYDELRRCAGCHDTAKDAAGNSTHRNAIGISGEPSSPTLTGKGWLSGPHGRSQDAEIVSNTYCAWCHAPSQPGVTNDIDARRPIKSGRNGVSCIACHASDAVDATFGTYQATFRPGGDRESLVDFIPRQPASGTETNAQCLFCHIRRHAFAVTPHGDLVDSGELRCIDCHMAIYNITESGRRERYHNMKVAANKDPATCMPCHKYDDVEISARCVELVPTFTSIAHAVPPFE